MTDKVQKIREEVVRLKSQLLRGACSSQIAMETICKEEAYDEVLTLLDSLQEEPVSEDLEEEINRYLCYRSSSSQNPIEFNRDLARHFANWQKQHMMKEPVSEEFEEQVKSLWKEVNTGHTYSIISSYNIFYGVCLDIANWQKEQYEKERLKHYDELTPEQAQIVSDFVTQHLKKNNYTPSFIDAIEYGKKNMKEQMMIKAFDGDITFDYNGDDDKTYGCIAHDSFCLEDFGLKDRDKVKVIVMKEDVWDRSTE